MNKQKIVTPSGIGLAAVLRVGQLSWLVKLWDFPIDRLHVVRPPVVWSQWSVLLSLYDYSFSAFSALTLLVGWQEGIRPVIIEWWCAGMVICLQQGANYFHMVQLMPLPPIISCFIKIQNDLSFWCLFIQVVLEKRRLNGCSSSSNSSSISHSRAMHYSAKRSLAITCRLSICLWPWWIMTT